MDLPLVEYVGTLLFQTFFNHTYLLIPLRYDLQCFSVHLNVIWFYNKSYRIQTMACGISFDVCRSLHIAETPAIRCLLVRHLGSIRHLLTTTMQPIVIQLTACRIINISSANKWQGIQQIVTKKLHSGTLFQLEQHAPG